MEKDRRKIRRRKSGIYGNATKCAVAGKRKKAEKSRARRSSM